MSGHREPSGRGWAERAVRLLVRAYPSSFRATYGGEVAQVARDVRRALGAASWLDALGFWISVVADLGRQAAVEQVVAAMAAVRRPAARGCVSRSAGYALLTATAGNIAYDVGSVRNSMGVLALMLTALAITAGGALVHRGPRSR